MFDVRMFANVKIFNCSIFEYSLIFKYSKVQCSLFLKVYVFKSLNVRSNSKVALFGRSNFECLGKSKVEGQGG